MFKKVEETSLAGTEALQWKKSQRQKFERRVCQIVADLENQAKESAFYSGDKGGADNGF